jgi:hypothetical protein
MPYDPPAQCYTHLVLVCQLLCSQLSPICCHLQGQEAAAALLTQSRQYFSLTADFSEDVGGAAKVSEQQQGRSQLQQCLASSL